MDDTASTPITQETQKARSIISRPITLPCGLTLPNRLVKCPMQETLASPPSFDPPIPHFQNIYSNWAKSQYGLLITGQVQVDRRFLSVPGDVCTHPGSLEPEVLEMWREWARIAQKEGTPCIVQLAHPGRMSPAGAGERPKGTRALCPSEVPVAAGTGWFNTWARDRVLGTPKAMTVEEIDEAVKNFVRGAVVAKKAGFAGCQIHGAHGFLVSQFLSPHTNRRTDSYGGTPQKRLFFLQRLVREIRQHCPPPFCLSVKLNSGDYMAQGGLSTDEGLSQVHWLVNSGQVDFVEISGGNAEQIKSPLHTTFGKKSLSRAPKMKESTRIREAAFAEFGERIQEMGSPIPIQLSGGFRSRNGMADAIDSGICDLIGLGRAAVLEPDLPRKILLNPEIPDDEALAMSHQVRGMWFAGWFPAKVIGRGLPIQFFYYNMRRLGRGLVSDPDASIPFVFFVNVWSGLAGAVLKAWRGLLRNTGMVVE